MIEQNTEEMIEILEKYGVPLFKVFAITQIIGMILAVIIAVVAIVFAIKVMIYVLRD